jgi:hypothetical protein
MPRIPSALKVISACRRTSRLWLPFVIVALATLAALEQPVQNLHRSRPLSRNLLSRGELETAWPYHRTRQGLHQQTPKPFH